MNRRKKAGFLGILMVFTLLLTGCEFIDRSLVDMGIVKDQSEDYQSINQGELEEYNRLAQEAYKKGVDPHKYAK